MEAAKTGGKEERREKGADYSTELEYIIIYKVFKLKNRNTKSDNTGVFCLQNILKNEHFLKPFLYSEG